MTSSQLASIAIANCAMMTGFWSYVSIMRAQVHRLKGFQWDLLPPPRVSGNNILTVVCLIVNSITQKVTDGFSWNLGNRQTMNRRNSWVCRTRNCRTGRWRTGKCWAGIWRTAKWRTENFPVSVTRTAEWLIKFLARGWILRRQWCLIPKCIRIFWRFHEKFYVQFVNDL